MLAAGRNTQGSFKRKAARPDVNLATIAKVHLGLTGADLANLLNEVALFAVRHGKAITQQEIEDATIKVVMGAEKSHDCIG